MALRVLLAMFLFLPAEAFAGESLNQTKCDNVRTMNANCESDKMADVIERTCRDINESPNDNAETVKARVDACAGKALARATTSCNTCRINFPPQPPVPKNKPVTAKEKGSDPADKGRLGRPRTDPAQCQSSESCLKTAAQDHREAAQRARLTKDAFEDGAQDNRVAKKSTISAATKLLQAWESNLIKSKAGAQEQSRLQHDNRLLILAQRDPGISRKDAASAYDPGMRDLLKQLVEIRESEREFEEEAKESARRELEFSGVADKAEERAKSLGFQWEKEPAARANHSYTADANLPVLAPSSQMVNRSTIAVASKGREEGGTASRKISARSPSSLKAQGKEESSSAAKGKADAASERRLRPGNRLSPRMSLRDYYRKRMQEGKRGGVDKDALDEKAFSRDLEQAAGGAGASRGQGNTLAADVLAGLMHKGEESSPWISIGAEETDRRRRALMEEAGIEEEGGDFYASGMLGIDSPSLFDRVRQAHLACQARQCINP